MTRYIFLYFLPLFTTNLFAEIRPSLLVSDNMVLQRNAPLPIWGWADKGEKVTVSFNGQTLSAKPDKNGKWVVTFEAMPAGGPYEIVLSSKKSKLIIKNVMVGEVWICSGQSNMEWVLSNTENAEEEITKANYPTIRHFKVPRRVSPLPKDTLEKGKWQLSSPETAANFTAVGYYFAKELQEKLGVTVGLINTTWGGTVVETWMSAGAAKKVPEFQEQVEELENFDIATYEQKQKEKLMKVLGGPIPTTDEGMVNGKAVWASSELDEKGWKAMELPALWESKGLTNLDGIVWFRKTINLPNSFGGKEAMLHLSKIDDSDITWVNGVKVGEMTNSYNKDRVYPIPFDLLKTGKITITVRVDDTGGGGGIYGGGDNLKIVSSSGEEISLVGNWKYKVAKANMNFAVLAPNSNPTLLFNGMVKALIPYAMKGTIWYQGESNADRAYQYRRIFPGMIQDWRNLWKQGDFPFLFVQLANFLEANPTPSESNWAELREAQSMTLSLPNTGQAVIIDIGEADDIHPRNKEDVGKRLALNARNIAYGEDLVYSGPVYESMSVEGNKIRLKFKHVGGGLLAKDKYGYLKSFAIAGDDKKFVWAKAEIVGDEVIVYSESVNKPVAVRYAWANNPDDANLYNAEGLPASPFRTDDWDGVTKN